MLLKIQVMFAEYGLPSEYYKYKHDFNNPGLKALESSNGHLSPGGH